MCGLIVISLEFTATIMFQDKSPMKLLTLFGKGFSIKKKFYISREHISPSPFYLTYIKSLQYIFYKNFRKFIYILIRIMLVKFQ